MKKNIWNEVYNSCQYGNKNFKSYIIKLSDFECDVKEAI